jgi:hypothetical protein
MRAMRRQCAGVRPAWVASSAGLPSRWPRGFLPCPLRDSPLRTERPRRAERLSRQLGDGGKGVCPSGDCPSGSASSHHRAAILFCESPQFALRRLQLDVGSRRGARARKGKRHPSFVCDLARRRGGAFDLNEVSTKGRIDNLAELTRFFIDLIVKKAVRYFSRSPSAHSVSPRIGRG